MARRNADVRLDGTLRLFLADGRDVGHVAFSDAGWIVRLRDERRTPIEQDGFDDPADAVDWALAHPSLTGDRSSIPGARHFGGDGVVLPFWTDGAGRTLALLERSGRWGLTTYAILRTRRRIRVALLAPDLHGREQIAAGLSLDIDGWRVHRPGRSDLGPWSDPAKALASLARSLAKETPTAHARIRLLDEATGWADGLVRALAAEADPISAGAGRPVLQDRTAFFKATRGDGAALGTLYGAPGRWAIRPETPTGAIQDPRIFPTTAEAIAALLDQPRLAFNARNHGAEEIRGLLCLPFGTERTVGAVLRPHAAARRLGLRRQGRILAVAWVANTPTTIPHALVLANTDGRLRLCRHIHERGRCLKGPAEAAEALAAMAGGGSRHAALDLAARARTEGPAWWNTAETLRMRCLLETPEWIEP